MKAQARRWGTRGEDMPDDCHDQCARMGVLGVYFPHVWANGVARYTCQAGHSWTCSWGHGESGREPRWRGRAAVLTGVDE